jgi:glycosyltransferase involved in cell wall biosynthesis
METLSMGNLPRISVVIVTYNFAKYLRECIDSILAQTLRPCEIVIYDDCSTDESWSIITEYSRKHPGLFVVHRQPRNVGMHVNANTALQRATGDLVSCLDGDDRWLPRKLELEWAAMCRNPEAKIAYSNVYTINAAGQRTAVWHDGKSPQPPSGDVFVQVFSKRFFPGIRSIFRNPLLYRFVLE